MASSCSTCPVCLRELGWDIQGKLGKPENCDHLFCFTCIHEWAKNVNTCPVDRIKFNHIEVLSCKSQKLIRKVYVADHSLAQVLADPEDVTYCEICHECNREDRLLLCDGCDRGYHLECLVPPLDTIPEGDWYCTLCEPIVRSQHTIVFSSGEENSVTIASEESSEDSDTLQERQGARRRTGAHLVTNSEEDTSESEEDDSNQSDVYPRRPYAYNQLRRNCLESSSEDVETKSDIETETGQESNLKSGKQSDLDSEGSSTAGLNLGPRFRKSYALCSGSEQSGSDSEDSSAVGLGLGPRFRKSRALCSESEQSGSDSEDSLAVGLNRGPRKRRVLGSESEEEEGECDILLQQPIPKRRCRFKDLPHPNVLSLKEEDVCTSDYGSPSDKILSDTPGSTMCLLAKRAKKQTPVKDRLPCSNVGREGEKNSMSLKGKMPISSSRQAKKKVSIHVSSSDNDSNTSIHSGYCSPAHKFTLTSDKGSCDSTFVPVQHLKDSPCSSPHITRQHVALSRTWGQSDSKSDSDSFSAEGRILRSAKPSMQNGSFKALPDGFEEILSAGRSSVSKQAGTKKLSAKGTTKKQTKKRKHGRKHVVPRRNQPFGIKKKQRRRRRRKRKRRRFKQRKAPDVDPTYSPGITLSASGGSVQTRSHARTAATHSPRDPTFRAAVIEAYRHENTITGLQQAQALLRQRRESLLSTPLRYGTAAAMFGSNISTPISGYNTPLGPPSKKQQQDKPTNSSTSLSTPLSRVHRPASSSIDCRNRFADEVTRRTIPRRKLSRVSFPSTVHQQQSSPVPRSTLGNESIGDDLLGEICQNLDDLQSKTNVIRRDGSILPINAESSSLAHSQTREAKPSNHQSSHSWKDTGLPPVIQDGDRAHPQQKVHHRPLDCRSTFSPKPKLSQDYPMSWGSVVAGNSTPRLKSSSHCSDSTHAQVQQPSSSFDQHTCSSLHTQPPATSEKDNDTWKHKYSRPSPSNGSLAHTLVKQIVKRYYKAKEITDREYKRILEKATVKVEAGHQPINEGRVERLIADYVVGYKRNRTALTL